MSKDSVNEKSFVAGEGLGHIAALTAETLHPRAATISLVMTMMKVIENEPDEEAADYCIGAMLAYTDGLKRAAEKAEALDASFCDFEALLANLCGALDADSGDDEGEG